ncbi:hypothetical protein ACU635_51080 [[Actinomadura] parvosata]|uniref:hypothetical protein n=1 Tax=[Actinomadura] parvosata TaxID=1955412 RepID=UPI00406CD16A
MIWRIILMTLWLAGACSGAALAVKGLVLVDGDLWDTVVGFVITLLYGRWFVRELQDARAAGKSQPIVLERPDAADISLDFEGGAFDDPDAPGWQVVPYSTARAWTCDISEADAVEFRGAPGVISFAEARRMAAALAATADYAEHGPKGERS